MTILGMTQRAAGLAKRTLAGVFACVLALQVVSAAQAAPPHVSDVRVGLHGERTRIVLDLDQGVDFDIFTLPEPYRVVLDLPEVDWSLDLANLPEDKGALSQMRYGLFTPGTSRMVFDVKGPVAVHKQFLLKPVDGQRWRLVVDLQPTSETVFLENLARQREEDRKQLDKLVASTASNAAVPIGPDAPDAQEPARPAPPTVRQTAPSGTEMAMVPPRKPNVPGRRIIAIDPGHGGVDPGTIGSNAYEKNITLALGRDLKQALEATGRYKVVMTRDRDIFLRLRDRVKVARQAGAELFISVHADSIKNRKIRGLSVYTLSEKASDKEAAKLAAKENKADVIAGIDLTAESADVTNILLDLAQRETMNQSARFAKELVSELRREVKLLRNTHRFAGFAVLKAPDMPSVLVEAGFLSNRQDERNLQSRDYRRKLAEAIVRGVDRHFTGIEEAAAY